MRKLVQIAILFVVVFPMLFLAPTFSSKTLVEESASLKKFKAIDCSLAYSVFQMGLNHRYAYVVDSNGSTEVVGDFGWRLDSSTSFRRTPPIEGVANHTGTVEFIDIEGGFYGIVGDDGYRYDPLSSLPQEYAVDGLRVRFSVLICSNCVDVHMWGYIVEITSISRL